MAVFVRASRDFVVLSLDGSRQLDDNLNGAENVTVDSLLDHYCARPATSHFEGMTLLEFAQSYRTPKKASGEGPVCRKKVIVITRPCCSPDPLSPNYEQYCRQKLMLYRSFRRLDELLGSADTHSAAYTVFLLSGAVPPSLADDIQRLEAAGREARRDNDEESIEDEHETPQVIQDWMLICQYNAEFSQSTTDKQDL